MLAAGAVVVLLALSFCHSLESLAITALLCAIYRRRLRNSDNVARQKDIGIKTLQATLEQNAEQFKYRAELLQTEIEKLNESCQKKAQEYEAKALEYDLLQNTIQEMQMRLDSNHETSFKLELTIKELLQTQETQRNHNASLELKSKEDQVLMDQQLEQIETLHLSSSELSEALELAQKEKQLLTGENEIKQKALELALKEKQTLIEENQTKQKIVVEQKGKLEKLGSQLTEATTQIEKQHETQKLLELQVQDLQTQLEAVTSALQGKIGQLSDQLEEARKRVEQHASGTDAEKQVKGLEESLRRTKENLETVSNEKLLLQHKSKDLQSQLDRQMEAKGKLEIDFEKTIQQLAAEREQSKKKQSEHETISQRYLEQFQQLAADQEVLRKQIEDDKTSAEAKAMQLEEQMAEKDAQLQSLQEEKHELEDELREHEELQRVQTSIETKKLKDKIKEQEALVLHLQEQIREKVEVKTGPSEEVEVQAIAAPDPEPVVVPPLPIAPRLSIGSKKEVRSPKEVPLEGVAVVEAAPKTIETKETEGRPLLGDITNRSPAKVKAVPAPETKKKVNRKPNPINKKDPAKCTVQQLKSWLTELNVPFPQSNRKKQFYIDLVRQHDKSLQQTVQ